jgi:uracil-DNA glycosylase family 4
VPGNEHQLTLPIWNQDEVSATDTGNGNPDHENSDSDVCDNEASGHVQGTLWPELTQDVALQQEDQITEHGEKMGKEGRGETSGEELDLEGLEAECLTCAKCGLRAGCTHVVFGEGNPEARVMLVGEGPGRDEDRQGRPFVGAAGQLLDKILASVGLSRDEVYITNVVKCRPPKNRMPNPDEVLACSHYLDAQINRINPAIIVCLGALATRTLVDKNARITRIRGQWHEKDGILYMPTFHPAALLRDPSKKRPVWEDMKKVKEALENL